MAKIKKNTKTQYMMVNKKGQVVVEYILLLVVVVSVAAAILTFVDVDEHSPGALIDYWREIVKKIAGDLPPL